jgi:aspartate aminotransferase-like enzyme
MSAPPPRAESLLLMTPGPTRLPDRVLEAGGQPMIHHRTAAFSRILVSVIDRLRPVLGMAGGDLLPVHTTGRGGMEAAVANLFCPGDELIACCNGKFGELWANLAESYGVVVHRVCTAWERGTDAAEVEQALNDHPRARAVTVAYTDTSTGGQNDVQAILALTRARGVLGMVDGISSFGGVPFQFDAWGADVAVTASQKCLMASPGVAFVAVSERAWAAYDRGTLPRNYWDLGEARKVYGKTQPETTGTAPVHVYLQLAASLTLIHQEGLDTVFERHEELGRLTRELTASMGLELLFPTLARQSPTLTALRAPRDITPKAIRDAMRQRGILLAGGLGEYTGTSFRIGHMGDIRTADVRRTCTELAAVLAELSSGARSATPAPVGG